MVRILRRARVLPAESNVAPRGPRRQRPRPRGEDSLRLGLRVLGPPRRARGHLLRRLRRRRRTRRKGPDAPFLLRDGLLQVHDVLPQPRGLLRSHLRPRAPRSRHSGSFFHIPRSPDRPDRPLPSDHDPRRARRPDAPPPQAEIRHPPRPPLPPPHHPPAAALQRRRLQRLRRRTLRLLRRRLFLTQAEEKTSCLPCGPPPPRSRSSRPPSRSAPTTAATGQSRSTR
mmetsp:Transcript_24784/g.80159  ORF Transcript_24784/g.80159 Transcript_24784/m.80159 type:complete len:227 (+) Transcript_24784:539-1219(+)